MKRASRFKRRMAIKKNRFSVPEAEVEVAKPAKPKAAKKPRKKAAKAESDVQDK